MKAGGGEGWQEKGKPFKEPCERNPMTAGREKRLVSRTEKGGGP